MKQGTNFLLPITIEYDLTKIEKVEFIFKQLPTPNPSYIAQPKDIPLEEEISLEFIYPSDTATLSDTEKDVINLHWNEDDTFKFIPDKYIYMDTRITLTESDQNPETKIIKLKMSPTLFKKDE